MDDLAKGAARGRELGLDSCHGFVEAFLLSSGAGLALALGALLLAGFALAALGFGSGSFLLSSLLVDLLSFVASSLEGLVLLTHFALEAGVLKLAMLTRLAQGG